jgi:hypothetical protein
MHLTEQARRAKLARLSEIEGYPDVEALLRATVTDSVSPGICCRPGCDYTTEVEPDQERGWCEACGAPGVKSAMILAELI